MVFARNRPLSRNAIAIQNESGDSTGVMCSMSQCELRSLSTFPNLRVTNVIRIVT